MGLLVKGESVESETVTFSSFYSKYAIDTIVDVLINKIIINVTILSIKTCS